MPNSVAESTELLPATPAALQERFLATRLFSEKISEPLEVEDYVVQSMPDVSPMRWHLAHTTWFFETFVLRPYCPDYRPSESLYGVLFNSYYNTVGQQFPRPQRGLLTRPTVAEIWAYRRRVDRAMTDHLASGSVPDEARRITELGIQHEQQHQELMLTDIKHVFSCNPLHPAYRALDQPSLTETEAAGWCEYEEGLVEVGYDGTGFCFDNEMPRHRTFLPDFRLQDRLVTNGEYLSFVEDGGYRQPELWLSLGWESVTGGGWQAPLYWRQEGSGWHEFTLSGLCPLDLNQPVCHVSYFEADAFARWSGLRLPTEFEWEHAADVPCTGNLVESDRLHPAAAPPKSGALRQCFGDVWEWTASQYTAYPGYRPPSGALGEYNGKFMCNQFVLRGGSCGTPQEHIRGTYRNFFPPDARWQFTGIRLAE